MGIGVTSKQTPIASVTWFALRILSVNVLLEGGWYEFGSLITLATCSMPQSL